MKKLVKSLVIKNNEANQTIEDLKKQGKGEGQKDQINSNLSIKINELLVENKKQSNQIEKQSSQIDKLLVQIKRLLDQNEATMKENAEIKNYLNELQMTRPKFGEKTEQDNQSQAMTDDVKCCQFKNF